MGKSPLRSPDQEHGPLPSAILLPSSAISPRLRHIASPVVPAQQRLLPLASPPARLWAAARSGILLHGSRFCRVGAARCVPRTFRQIGSNPSGVLLPAAALIDRPSAGRVPSDLYQLPETSRSSGRSPPTGATRGDRSGVGADATP